MWRYTTILHDQRIKLGLTTNQYCVLDIIYHSQTHPRHSDEGWCKHGCQKIGDFLGLRKQTVMDMISSLAKEGFVVKGKNGRKKVTDKFYKIYDKSGGQETVPVDNKEGAGNRTPKGQETVPLTHSILEEKEIKAKKSPEGSKKISPKIQEAITQKRDRKTLLEHVKRVVKRKKATSPLWKEYFKVGTPRLITQITDYLMSSNFDYENDGALAKFIEGYMKIKEKEDQQEPIDQEMAGWIQKCLDFMKKEPYQFGEPRKYEIIALRDWIQKERENCDHVWILFTTMIDLFHWAEIDQKYKNLKYATTKFFEDNEDSIRQQSGLEAMRRRKKS